MEKVIMDVIENRLLKSRKLSLESNLEGLVVFSSHLFKIPNGQLNKREGTKRNGEKGKEEKIG